MTGEYGLATMPIEETLYAVQALLTKSKPSPVFQQPSSSQIPPKFIADGVAENGGGGDHENEIPEIEQSAFREEAPYHYETLSRHGQTEKSLALHRHDQEDDEITPMTQAIHKTDQVIEQNIACAFALP